MFYHRYSQFNLAIYSHFMRYCDSEPTNAIVCITYHIIAKTMNIIY